MNGLMIGICVALTECLVGPYYAFILVTCSIVLLSFIPLPCVMPWPILLPILKKRRMVGIQQLVSHKNLTNQTLSFTKSRTRPTPFRWEMVTINVDLAASFRATPIFLFVCNHEIFFHTSPRRNRCSPISNLFMGWK